VIESDVWVGTKVTVLRGSIIGRGSVIGANSVVKGYFEPLTIAGGVPARVIRSRRETTSEAQKEMEHKAYVNALTQAAQARGQDKENG
jgi:acetyltransferase-like isoleucine patch superfamily enzyme